MGAGLARSTGVAGASRVRGGGTGDALRSPGRDVRLIVVSRAARGLAFGYLAVVLGVELRRRGLSAALAGVVLSAFVGGATLSLIAVRRYGDRLGRRRVCFAGYVLQAAAGVVLVVSSSWWLLALVGLSGSLSAEVVDASPFGALEQVMIASTVDGHRHLRSFGCTGAVGAAAGSLGALGAGIVDLGGEHAGTGPMFVPIVICAVIGAVCARSLSAAVEPVAAASLARSDRQPATSAGRSRSSGAVVGRLSALFALDSFGAGFTVQAFVAYWLQARYGAGPLAIGSIFFAVGILHSVSMGIAVRLGERFGILVTMVFTHLLSNGFLVALAFAPSLPVAAVLLCLRAASSEMDVPTRQAYVMALVPPRERTWAAGTTTLARAMARPAGPALAGLAQSVTLGAPFIISGGLKAVYDVSVRDWIRRVPLVADVPSARLPGAAAAGAAVAVPGPVRDPHTAGAG